MNPTDIRDDLLKEAADYVHTPASYTTLEPFKTAILTLRAKYASYEIIVEMLNKHDIKVSESTLRRFCRRHNKEMKQIRQEWNSKRREAIDQSQPALPVTEHETATTKSTTHPVQGMRGMP